MDEALNTRDRILDAAESLFARNGYDATATSAVATRAAVPKGLLFYYFPTKMELLRALVDERMGPALVAFESVVEQGNPVRSLLNVAARLREAQEESAVLRVIIWREERTHPEVRASLRDHRRHLQEAIEHVLRQSVGAVIPAKRIGAAARAWVAMLGEPSLADLGATKNTDADKPHAHLVEVAQLICDGLVLTPQR
ncbi:MAG: TetR family transcriptional regulator [Frondihabitans sp.]|nr:TetR family transcriptional regulator [Frondihabitans sp.]